MVVIVGVNYRTAPLSVRETVALNEEQLIDTLQDLRTCVDLANVVLLSTCNRTEMYFDEACTEQVIQWMINRWGLSSSEFEQYFYIYEGQAAFHHAVLVASGLDSMVVGEREIIGQIKKAILFSKEAGLFTKYLSQFFQMVFVAAKKVRTETTLGLQSLSIATVVSQLVQGLENLPPKISVLLIGAGETIRLIAEHFRVLGIENIAIANRTLARAEALATRIQGQAVSLSDIIPYLSTVDLVVTATSSKSAILTEEIVMQALPLRRQPVLYLVDVSVPRNIAAEVGYLEKVQLYCVDDLQDLGQYYPTKEKILSEALPIIQKVYEDLRETIKIRPFSNTICALRQKCELIRDQVLQEALQQLESGKPPNLVLERMAHLLINRLMHDPTIRLRQAGYTQDEYLFETVQRLFNLA